MPESSGAMRVAPAPSLPHFLMTETTMIDPRHIPVLRDEALAALELREGGVYLDGTFGAGGYTRAMLSHKGVRVIALDRDPDAIRNGQAMVAEFDSRLTLIHSPFGAMEQVVHEPLDGIVLDIGVSSMQIDEEQRGFSLRFDGPLDMRMDQNGRSAADIVNTASDEELADIFFHFGEERASRRIARAIVHDRQVTPFTTTLQLASMIGRIMPHKPHEMHPATRTYQALRIADNAVVLHVGHVVANDTALAVAADDQLRQYYLGMVE